MMSSSILEGINKDRILTTITLDNWALDWSVTTLDHEQ